MLADEKLVAFLTTANAAAARAFYEGVLELTLLTDDQHLMVFESGASRVALQKGERASPPHGTAVGWNVADLAGTIRTLMARGVAFFDQGPDKELPIWSPVPGHGVAWFKDPDGNTLSLSGTI